MNMKKIAKIMAKRPRTVILAFAILTILIGSQATNLYMVTDFAEYLPQDNPILDLWNEINEEFSLGSAIIILVNQTDRYHSDVRDYEVLMEMYKVYYTLYEKPKNEGKDSGIASINNLAALIRDEYAKDGFIEIGNVDQGEVLPKDQSKIYDYMEKLSISSMKGVLYTRDYKYAAMVIQLKDKSDFEKVLSNVEHAIEKEGNDETEMTITGTLAMQKAIQTTNMRNILIIFPVALIFVAIVLFYFHRTFKGVIIAFFPVAFALVLTFGTLGTFAPQLSILSIAIVALLMGLGVDYSIYLMNRLTEEKNMQDNVERIEKILRSTGKAVLLSTITTFIGFSSLMISSMHPMVLFGFGCAVGILYCFFSAVILVPCLVTLLKFEKTASIPRWKKFANIIVKNRKRIILIASFFAILSLTVLPNVKTDANYYAMSPEGIPEVEAMFEYSEKFGNGGNFNAFLVETDPYGLENPEVLEAIYEMEQEMRTTGASVSSIVDSLVKVNEILSRSIIIEKFNNLTDADNLIFDKIAEGGVVNSEHSKTIILVTLPVGIGIQETEKIVKELNEIAEDSVIPENGRISKLTGQDAVYVAVNNKLKDEQSRSMMIALILVFAVLIIIFNSKLYGALTMIPVIFVLMWEPGFLVSTNIPLSPVTITIASIMIGVGIDYGVHIIHRYREEYENGLSKIDAIKKSVEKTGLSLTEAAITTSAGVGSIFIVNVSALNEFVIVIIFMISVSCVAAAMVIPAFLSLKKIRKK